VSGTAAAACSTRRSTVAQSSPACGPAAKLRELVTFIEAAAAAGDPAQQAVLERGDVAIYERDIADLDGWRPWEKCFQPS
jgi:hypothetical protein